MNENNYEYNIEDEQLMEEHEGEEIENHNIQKDEGEERRIGDEEGLVEIEDNNYSNYEENEYVEGEREGEGEVEGEVEGEGELEREEEEREDEEKIAEYNVIEENNINREGDDNNEEN